MTYEIRPLSLGEILDGSFQLYRNNFSTFFATVVAISLPAFFVIAIVNWALTGTLSAVPTPHAGSGRFFAVLLVSLPVSFGSAILQNSILTMAISDSYLGRPVSVGAAFRRTISVLGTLIDATVRTFLGMFFGLLLFIVPGIIFMLNWLFTVQAIVVEGYDASASLKRSKKLAAGRRGRLMLLLLLLTIINLAISWGAGAVIPASVRALPLIGSLLEQFPAMLLAPVYHGVITLAYFDARVRTEAFDLEMLSRGISGTAPAVGPSAAPRV